MGQESSKGRWRLARTFRSPPQFSFFWDTSIILYLCHRQRGREVKRGAIGVRWNGKHTRENIWSTCCSEYISALDVILFTWKIHDSGREWVDFSKEKPMQTCRRLTERLVNIYARDARNLEMFKDGKRGHPHRKRVEHKLSRRQRRMDTDSRPRIYVSPRQTAGNLLEHI